MTGGRSLAGLLILTGLALGAVLWMRGTLGSGTDSEVASVRVTASGAREYGALTEMPARRTRTVRPDDKKTSVPGAKGSAQSKPSTQGATTDSATSKKSPTPKRPTRARRVAVGPTVYENAHQYQAFGRPAQRWNAQLLAAHEYSAEQIEEIHEKFKAYLTAIRGGDPSAPIKPFMRLTDEERAANQALREQLLTDAEFDAALYATQQQNRSYFAGPISSHTSAAQVGLQAGDDLIKVNGRRVFDSIDYSDARDTLTEGQLHELVIHRKGDFFDVQLLCCTPGWGRVQMKIAPPLVSEP